MKRLGLDLDGVLFDFNTHFCNLAKSKFSVSHPPIDHTYPDRWDYQWDFITKAQNRELWNHIIQVSPDWWYRCPTYPWSRDLLEAAYEHGDEIYFITARSAKDCQWQTSMALRDISPDCDHHGAVITVPSADQKFPIINSLGIDYYVDDKMETVRDAHVKCPNTQIAVWDRPWNRKLDHPTRLKSVEDYKKWLG